LTGFTAFHTLLLPTKHQREKDLTMATRVLSSDQAKMSITTFISTLNGGLEGAISSLNTEGTTLSDPNVWDGAKAEQFRDQWADTSGKLKATQDALAALHQQIDGINKDIMTAGGNA
jgi:uncharacterized protein YukE